MSGKSYHEILKDTQNFTCSVDLSAKIVKNNEPVKELVVPTIPDDSIDITDINQCEFYKDNEKQYEFINRVRKYCEDRRLFTAINRPKAFYISFGDRVHKKRLIIPFYSEAGKIDSYQSRTLEGDTYPKYLTKFGEKGLYGENNISNDIPYIFVFEGPIDAMFVKNAVAVGGASTTEKQEAFLKKCVDKEIIYVYDNDKDNKEMKKKIKNLIKDNKKVFIWPKELKKYKDVNEVCCNLCLDELPYRFIIQNSYSGIEALMKQKPI